VSVYRRLAVLSVGPVCSECTHVHPGDYAHRLDLWRCRASKSTGSPGWSRHIDGVGREPVVEYGWCTHKNSDGNCKDYEPQDGRS
jgi:hypothetical protein